ncbi:MAG: hypothetical protein ACC645_02805 [Pirellulales bacterium]
MRHRIAIVVAVLVVHGTPGAPLVDAAEGVAPFTEDELVARVSALTKDYLRDFRHPETYVLYGARLSTRQAWTSPQEVKDGKPKPWGYGSRIADTALHCGHLLVALLDAYEARPDPVLKENIAKTFAALKLIGSLPELYPKPGKPALVGLVPRGPHPDDVTAYYDDSSMDQHTTYIISLSRYARSSLAGEEDKAWIRQSLGKIGRRLEKNGWSIKQGDGVTEAHVGFAWTGFHSDHASILLPAVYALYRGTGDRHWLQTYETFLAEKDGLRWKRLHPGPHVRINGHPIYANQNAFRVHALYRMENDSGRKAVLRGLLKQFAEMQLQRDFPGPFYKRFHSAEEWSRLRRELGWQDENLHGCDVAWDAFQPSMLDQSSLAVLAHVRFPLGGFHMVLLSEDPKMIQQRLGPIWKMLTTVDLTKISAGETNYLFTVVALHTYAFCFRHPDLFASEKKAAPSHDENGKELPFVANAELGPTIDVAIAGDHAYAVGRGKLYVLDITDPVKPRTVGSLDGLGSVRQILVTGGIAYITSREDGLFMVNVKHPDKPHLSSHYDTIEFATGVAISGDVLFVACRHYGVELIDVSAPAKPVHLSTIRTGEAQSVVARGKWLYVGVWAASEVVVVDVRNPRKPGIVARVALDGYGDGVDVRGPHLYAATGHHSRGGAHRNPDDPGFGRGHGLEIFDVSDPAQPQFVSRVKFPRLYNMQHDMWGVTVVGDHAFVADTHNGIFVVDVADAEHPKIAAHRKLPYVESQESSGFAGGLALTEDLIYVAGGATDLHLVAASGMARPVAGEAATAPSIPPRHVTEKEDRFRVYRTEGQVHAVGFLGERAVVACGSAGVHVVELWPSIKQLSKFETQGFATDVAVSGEYVMIAAGTGGLLICAWSEQGQLVRKGQYRAGGRAIKQVEVPVPGKYALVQAGANNLHVVDIRDPAAPKRILNESRPGLLYGDQLMRGLAENRYACVFWHVSGLHWYDMHADPEPTYSGDTCPLRIGSSNGLVEYKGKTLATLRGGYVLLDRGEHRSLAELPVRHIGSRHDLGKPTVFGHRLGAANRATGVVTVIDIDDITQPKLIEQFETPGNPGRILIRNGAWVIPDGYHGLLVGAVDEEKVSGTVVRHWRPILADSPRKRFLTPFPALP